MSNEQFLEIPEDLCPKGRAAAKMILKTLRKHDATYAGGQRMFCSPTEWEARGEGTGHGSFLIIIHECGNHTGFFSFDARQYDLQERMCVALEELDLFTEQLNHWSSAVYDI